MKTTIGRALLVVFLSSSILISGVGCSSETIENNSDTAIDAVTGSERTAIMDALRATVKPELANQDIVFNVSGGSIRAKQGWCWLMGKVELRGGGEPTTTGTAYEEDARGGLFDGFRIEALLRKEGATWKVVTHGIGSTDAWYWGIEESYPDAPRSIFPWLTDQDQAAIESRAERRTVMDSLRAKVKPELANQDIVFNVSRGSFAIAEDFCWIQGTIELRGGGEPTTTGTAYEEDARGGLFDGFRIEALLQKENGRWIVREHGIGSTDVWYNGIENSYPAAPRSIFPWLR